MSKPGRRTRTPSEEIAHFTDREDLSKVFLGHLISPVEPPVLMFYGMGGAGKTWLLKKLIEEVPDAIPKAFLDFDRRAGGRRFALDPAAALFEIRQQLGKPAPRFDLAYGVLRVKQGASEELGVITELAAEILSKALTVPAALLGHVYALAVPGAAPILKRFSKRLKKKLKGTQFERLLARSEGQKLVLELKVKTAQEIAEKLLDHLAEDLRQSLKPHLNRAVTAVLFFDTFEAIGSEEQNEEHKHQYEQWVRDVASNFDFALTVIAGQNRLTWDEIDPEWKKHLDQHLVGGLSEKDARLFLDDCGVKEGRLQNAILATSKEEDGGFHCYSLGLCVDIVDSERSRGLHTAPESLHFAPQDWEKLAHRFLKSLGSNAEARWIERLALTPRFDEKAARKAFSADQTTAQDAAWEILPHYSFVERQRWGGGWLSVREQMRRALHNQPSADERVSRDHDWWKQYWSSRSASPVDQTASLAWYHEYLVEPMYALGVWKGLAEATRTEVPPHMRDHFALLQWWDSVGLSVSSAGSQSEAFGLELLGGELCEASLGNRSLNLHRAINCFETALRVYKKEEFPRDWASNQANLGLAWVQLPTGSRAENLRRAIDCYESALRVYTEEEFPQPWAVTQNHLGFAWSQLELGYRQENLHRAIEHHEAALRVLTEKDFPEDWAGNHINMGIAWSHISTGSLEENLRCAIDCYLAALRVFKEKESPHNWAKTQNNLGLAWCEMPTGETGRNLHRAIECFEAALRVRTEQAFPVEWAATQINLGIAWNDMQIGDRGENLRRAIDCYQAALRIFTEGAFPGDWAKTQNNLASAWIKMDVGDLQENLDRAIACCKASLRVYTEQEYPEGWARTQGTLGHAWSKVMTGDRTSNLRHAIDCYEAAMRVFKEEEFPKYWAMTQQSLGKAWSEIPTGDQSETALRAIQCYEDVLRVWTEQASPEEWARTQNQLGHEWSRVLTGDRDDNVHRAIGCYEAALRRFREQEFPESYALTQNNLGCALCMTESGDRVMNLRNAIACFESALHVYSEQNYPQEYKTTKINLRKAQDALDGLDD